MRVLILGAGGMLGHKVWEVFRDRFECRGAMRTRLPLPLFDDERVTDGFDATNFDAVARLIATEKPDVVVNCIGVVKQLAAAHDPIASITLNSLFPHVVARACGEVRARMIHISTDCVFAGTRSHTPDDSRRSDSLVRPPLKPPRHWGSDRLENSSDEGYSQEVGLESPTYVSPTYVFQREDDLPDATDLYGRSKLLGEVSVPHLTIRTSIIG